MDALDRARAKRKQMIKDGVKPVFNPIVKSDSNKTSMRLAINAACFQCYGGTREDKAVSKEIREGIANCKGKDTCALWRFRSYK